MELPALFSGLKVPGQFEGYSSVSLPLNNCYCVDREFGFGKEGAQFFH